jgi:hypothetical protein
VLKQQCLNPDQKAGFKDADSFLIFYGKGLRFFLADEKRKNKTIQQTPVHTYR